MDSVTLPPPEALSLLGMAVVALFAVWKLQVAPRLRVRGSTSA